MIKQGVLLKMSYNLFCYRSDLTLIPLLIYNRHKSSLLKCTSLYEYREVNWVGLLVNQVRGFTFFSRNGGGEFMTPDLDQE